LALVPPLALIFIVLGSIITGIATVNQAGAVGAVGATIMAGYRLYEGRKGAYWPAIIAGVSVLGILIVTTVHTVNVRLIQTQADVIAITIASILVVTFLIGVIWSGWRTLKTDDTMQGVVMETAKTTALVFIILLGAAMLTSAFRAFGGEELVKEFLQGLPGGFWSQFIIVMLVIFLLGFFLDFIEIAVVVVPIVAPILLADPSANVTAVWLGVMIGLNIQTSFLTPPFGFALFYLRGVAPAAVKTIQMYKGVVPFIALQLIALVIVGYNPQLVNYLPLRMSLLAETAPPPANPRLQACIEDYISEQYETRGGEITASIEAARSWDLSGVPDNIAADVQSALDNASQAMPLLAEARGVSAQIAEASVDYVPVLRVVRHVEQDIVKHDEEIEEVEQLLSRLQRNQPELTDDIDRLAARLAVLQEERVALDTATPAEWEELRPQFSSLLTSEKRAYGIYRRTTDSAYEPILEFANILRGADSLSAMREEIAGLADIIPTEDPDALTEIMQGIESRVGEIAGAGDVRTALSEARRKMRTSGNEPPDPDAALVEHMEAMEILDAEIAWRTEVSGRLLSDVEAYESAIAGTIGLRQLDAIPRDVALYIASCNSTHRDISIYF